MSAKHTKPVCGKTVILQGAGPTAFSCTVVPEEANIRVPRGHPTAKPHNSSVERREGDTATIYPQHDDLARQGEGTACVSRARRLPREQGKRDAGSEGQRHRIGDFG